MSNKLSLLWTWISKTCSKIQLNQNNSTTMKTRKRLKTLYKKNNRAVSNLKKTNNQKVFKLSKQVLKLLSRCSPHTILIWYNFDQQLRGKKVTIFISLPISNLLNTGHSLWLLQMIWMLCATVLPPRTKPACTEVLSVTLILPTAVMLSKLLLITNLLYRLSVFSLISSIPKWFIYFTNKQKSRTLLWNNAPPVLQRHHLRFP